MVWVDAFGDIVHAVMLLFALSRGTLRAFFWHYVPGCRKLALEANARSPA